ncbi:MAG: radical SAM protein [Candidatus Gracilibacteria bacterium]|nr:radical SAM protein [Candidatus Gracilibacteria bacterium]
MYINEIIRITYKCNWDCKFCNVINVNNFGKDDISEKEIVFNILSLGKKYSKEELGDLILSFSGGEPTLNKNLAKYIRLAKNIGIGTIQIQTNGTILFKKKELLFDLIEAGLDELFLAQHGHIDFINKEMGCFYKQDNFVEWINFIKKNKLQDKIKLRINIVICKINLAIILDYLIFLKNLDFLEKFCDGYMSLGFVQPNGYAEINAEEVLLKYTEDEILEIDNIIRFAEDNNIFLDLHYTCPPLCIINYPQYNLENKNLNKLKIDIENDTLIAENLKKFKYLWNEKIKFRECSNCKYNNFCKGFYKNWIKFVGEEFVKNKVKNFLLIK